MLKKESPLFCRDSTVESKNHDGNNPADVPPLIPLELFLSNPEQKNPQFSPDGKQLAYLAPANNVTNVWIKTIGKDDDRPVTNHTKNEIYNLRCSCDSTFLRWSCDGKYLLYVQDKDGDEKMHLYRINIETHETKDLTPFEQASVVILSISDRFPQEALITMAKAGSEWHDVYRLNIATGNRALVEKNPGNIVRWVVDERWNMRAAFCPTSDGGYTILVRNTQQEAWRTLFSWGFEDTLMFLSVSSRVFFSRNGKFLYISDSSNTNTACLVKVSIATGKKEVVIQDKTHDFEDLWLDPYTETVQAIAITGQRKKWQFFDESMKKDFKIIMNSCQGDLAFFDSDAENKYWIVCFNNDTSPLSYYLYDREGKQISPLFIDCPALQNYKLASMKPIVFTSRDNIAIHGYITYPIVHNRKNLPMVLLVHGGPQARDTWGYNPEVQWLANRGYVVLQVNYHGSTGYGKQFLIAGCKEYGGKMQDDLIDAVHWAIDQGIADPKRIAIWGKSYGGYAALVGATATPDLFCCAVDICGFSDLYTHTKARGLQQKALEYKWRGDPETNKDIWVGKSPLHNVDHIKIPILIAHGSNDPRVRQIQADQMVATMKSRGLPHEYVLFSDEGHGFEKPDNRLKFYATAEKFLATYLGGRFSQL